MHPLKIESLVRAAGLRASVPDDRDIVYVPQPFTRARVRRDSIFPRIEDQGSEGVCTGETMTTIAEAIMNYGARPISGNGQLAPQFNYFYSRQLDGTAGDVGATPRDMCRSALHYGLCTDDLWPLSMPVDQEPSDAARGDAFARGYLGGYEVINYNGDDPDSFAVAIDSALAEGCLVALAFYCRRWMFYVSGPLGSDGHRAPPMPSGNTGMNELVGGHIVPLRGYEPTMFPNSGGGYIAQNSWGTGWGDGGLWSIERGQLTQPGFAMEARVFRGFAGITLAPTPAAPLTVAQITAARQQLVALELGDLSASGSFQFFAPVSEVAYYAAWRAISGKGYNYAQASQIVGVDPSAIQTFVERNADAVAAWAAL